MSLPKIDIPLSCGFIYQHCQIPDLVSQTSTSCMQPPWYNSNQMWISRRVPRPFQLNKTQEFQESSWVCERWCHKSCCRQNILRRTCWSKVFGKTQILPEKLIQEWWWMAPTMSIILLWNSAFCSGITSHLSTKHAWLLSLCCFEINRCLTFFFSEKIFWSNSNMQ